MFGTEKAVQILQKIPVTEKILSVENNEMMSVNSKLTESCTRQVKLKLKILNIKA